MKVTVVTISDRAYQGIYEDISGKEIENILYKKFKNIKINKIIVPDEREKIVEAFNESLSSDFILTTGGTGISERDITPEITQQFCEKQLPGISQILLLKSLEETPYAMLSRGYSGIKDKTIIVNFPGSVKAVKLCCKTLIPIMEHSIDMLLNKGH